MHSFINTGRKSITGGNTGKVLSDQSMMQKIENDKFSDPPLKAEYHDGTLSSTKQTSRQRRAVTEPTPSVVAPQTTTPRSVMAPEPIPIVTGKDNGYSVSVSSLVKYLK